jgi:RNA polymerase sigma factor (sigma-70 family)
MSDDRDARLQELLARLQRGDAAAVNELIGLAYDRLRLLARTILRRSFPRLREAHETDSVVNEAALRLLKALREVRPSDGPGLFRFAALQIRRVLCDLARDLSRTAEREAAAATLPDELADSTYHPETLSRWTELHEKIDGLPEEERAVVDKCLYLGLSQADAAVVLGVSPKEVSRRWVRAIRKLPDCGLV